MVSPLSTSIGGLRLQNPLIIASGPLTSSHKVIKRLIPYKPAAIVTKTVAVRPASPPRPNIFRLSRFSLLNCEDWSERSHEYWAKEGIPRIKEYGVAVIASIVSLSERGEELGYLAGKMAEAGADAIEITCLYDPAYLPNHVKIVKSESDLPVLTKISIPELRDEYVLRTGRKLLEAGADAIVVSDTYGPCLHVDISTCEPVLGKKDGSGRISGPAIKPFTMYFTALLARELNATVISCGGISTWEDVVEAVLLGASAVEICTAILLEGTEVIGRILEGLSVYLDERGMSIWELKGKALDKIKERLSLSEQVKVGLPRVNISSCTGCGLCARSCPLGAIEIRDGKAVIGDLCEACGLCVSICPVKAVGWS
ncbi:MAG: hypothetical protein DRN90_03535 [Thermoproteota archaeon]|nr:MAG: hypothetical protein DRN90_03535 [Candidatus Korarchaeota archaeon]